VAPSTSDWRRRAACHREMIDMFPDPDDGEAVRLAKKVCRGCPVAVKCLLDAEKVVAEEGPEQAQGVRGGLTMQERNTMYGLGRDPHPCPGCGLDCVPANLRTLLCASCRPNTQIEFDDYRLAIERLVRERLSYREIAEELRLKKDSVAGACRRWKLKIGKRSPGSGRRSVEPCGTLAAKTRHHRQRPYSWRDCPLCRFVPWTRGRPRVAA
jgi:Transcription factor WhiB